MRSTVVTLALLCGASCSPPYRPFCQPGPERQLTDARGTIAAHADGRVSVVTLRSSAGPDGGLLLAAEVGWFTADGLASDAFQVEVPPGLSAFGVAPPVAWPDGLASALPAAVPDGGVQVVVTLAHRDGGSTAVVVEAAPQTTFAPRAVLSQVGQTLQIRQGTDFLVMAFDGGVLSRTTSTALVQPLGDAFVAWPGPRLLNERLEPLSVTPTPELSQGVVAFGREGGRLVNARASAGDLLVDRFDLAGAVEEARRVSSALGVVAAAVSSSGDAVVFADGEDLVQALLWFAFLDADGRKRGPDVPLGPFSSSAPTLGVVLQPAGPGRFSLFVSQPSGVVVREVRCE